MYVKTTCGVEHNTFFGKKGDYVVIVEKTIDLQRIEQREKGKEQGGE